MKWRRGLFVEHDNDPLEERWRKLEEHLPAIKAALEKVWYLNAAAAALAFIESLEKEGKDVE